MGRRRATTEEGREAQMVSLASELAEKQIREGSASAQVITHYLKLGSSREKLEQARIERENMLLESKIDHLESAKRVEELYAEALIAMRQYSGQRVIEEDDNY